MRRLDGLLSIAMSCIFMLIGITFNTNTGMGVEPRTSQGNIK
jgi:hypothetical protein